MGKKEKNKKGNGKNSDALKQMREKSAGKKAKAPRGEIIAKNKFPVLTMTEAEKKVFAVKEDQRFRDLESGTRKNFADMMVILREFKVWELWKHVESSKGKAFKDFTSWLSDAAPLSRASGFAALKAGEKLLPYIPKEELAHMPRQNIELLSKVSKIHFEKVDSPLRQEAKKAKPKAFRKLVQKHAPEAHIEDRVKITVDASAAVVIKDAFAAAQVIGEVPEEEALEFISGDWLDSACTREDCQGMTNREAWYHLTQAAKAEATGEEILAEREAV